MVQRIELDFKGDNNRGLDDRLFHVMGVGGSANL
jgi:hypothetical protein